MPIGVKGQNGSTLHALEIFLIRPSPDDGQAETSSTTLPIRSGDRVMPAIIPPGDEIAIVFFETTSRAKE